MSLINVEVVGAIARKVRTDEIRHAEGQGALELWSKCLADGKVTLVQDSPYLPSAWKLACQYKHAIQDCLYLAIAANLNVPLLTYDAKFVKRTNGNGLV